jgi:hypothetical protein
MRAMVSRATMMMAKEVGLKMLAMMRPYTLAHMIRIPPQSMLYLFMMNKNYLI